MNSPGKDLPPIRVTGLTVYVTSIPVRAKHRHG